ncbi:MAG: sodium:calcium antiporter [Fimbriimonadales bacterium]|nr:MAG: sodium:calcium antiporter [Fimbriimonadales bacterium]
MVVVLLVTGLGLLILGAEALVRGAARLATAWGVSPLLVGLTVVAWGTSAPEFVVSVMAALNGQPDIAVGNVVGSNIFNVLFILGASAAVTPLVVSRPLVTVQVPILVVVSLLTWGLVFDQRLSRVEGLLLILGALAYTVFSIRTESAPANEELGTTTRRWYESPWYNALLVLCGLVSLVVGSRWFVRGAVELARWLGVSELVIGLTIVAAGTSLPELATSVVAALRGERDISVGNVVGSNLFNLLVVLGGAALVSSTGIRVASAALHFDIPVMVAVAVACLPVFFTGHKIARWEGWLFLAYGLLYWAYLLAASAEHDALPMFNRVMIVFVFPLTAITLLVSVARQLQRGRG